MPFDLGYEWGGDFIVAYDAVGGFFALRGKSSFYLAPETLEWRDLERGYTDLLHFTLYGDLAAFYGHVRWPGWEQEVEALPGDRAFSFYPPLYSQEGKDPAKCSRRAVPVTELWSLHSSGF